MPLMALPRRSPLAAAVLGTLSAVASAAAPVAAVAAELPAARAVAAGATAALNESGNTEALVAILEQLDFDRVALDEAFVTLCGVLVFLMQTGFCMLTAGSVRTKNVMNVLLKNMLDCCTGAVVFFLFGYAFAHGEQSNRFIGHSQFALTRFDNFSHAVFFFRWALSAASTTVVSGAIAERATFYAYLIYSVCISGFLYPVISHAVWDVNGWLSAHRPDPVLGIGMIDFGGSAVVHMSAGWCGFLGTLIIGPRIGRFDSNGEPVPIAGHSASLIVLGTLLLCTGAFGFNAGSMLHVATRADHELFGGRSIVLSTGESVLVSPTLTVSRCLVSTLLGASMSALVGLVISKWVLKVFDLVFICNCLLGGLVSVTAGCATLEPYVAMCVGGFSAVVYLLSSRLVLRIRVDDPVDASAVHFGCGVWGVLAVGLFSSERLQAVAGFPVTHFGLVYGGDWSLLGCQVIGMVAVIGSVTIACVPLFLLLRTFGILRVSAEQEDKGIDEFYHGASAYPEGARSPWDDSGAGSNFVGQSAASSIADALYTDDLGSDNGKAVGPAAVDNSFLLRRRVGSRGASDSVMPQGTPPLPAFPDPESGVSGSRALSGAAASGQQPLSTVDADHIVAVCPATADNTFLLRRFLTPASGSDGGAPRIGPLPRTSSDRLG